MTMLQELLDAHLPKLNSDIRNMQEYYVKPVTERKDFSVDRNNEDRVMIVYQLDLITHTLGEIRGKARWLSKISQFIAWGGYGDEHQAYFNGDYVNIRMGQEVTVKDEGGEVYKVVVMEFKKATAMEKTYCWEWEQGFFICLTDKLEVLTFGVNSIIGDYLNKELNKEV